VFNIQGSLCDVSCLDATCKSNCSCDNSCYMNNQSCSSQVLLSSNTWELSNTLTLGNGLVVSSSQLSLVNMTLTVNGDFDVQNSQLNLSSSSTFLSDFFLKNTTLFIDSSSNITIANCDTQLENATIVVNLSKYNIAPNTSQTNLTILNTPLNCSINLNSTKFQYVNVPQCYNIKSVNGTASITFLFTPISGCNPKQTTEVNPIPTWGIVLIIIIIVIVVAAIIFTLLALTIVPLRSKIFPHKRKKKQTSQLSI